MAPAASILVATSGASKRPAASSDAEQLLDSSSSYALPQVDDEAARSKSQKRQLECPRCRSTNTKFCYYNNYSTAQPRHFCRACRRYWTHGGTLRDVPVGGATRCSKRRRASAEPSSPLAHLEDACPPDLSTAFPFLSDGSYYLPQFDVGLFAPPAFSWPSVVPDFCDGLKPWDDGTVAGLTGPWGDIAGLELSWPPAEQLFVAAGFSSAASGSVLPSMQLQS